jgi:hypothetical protein
MDPTTPVLVTPQGSVTPRPPDNGKHYGLDELQGMVGGPIEILRLFGRNSDLIMVVNEEGNRRLQRGREGGMYRLPHNAIASQAFGLRGFILGTVLVCPSHRIR